MNRTQARRKLEQVVQLVETGVKYIDEIGKELSEHDEKKAGQLLLIREHLMMGKNIVSLFREAF